MPLEANLDHLKAIDFEKGCYLGQELTIRTKHRGVVRKRVLPVRFVPMPEPTSDATLVPVKALHPDLVDRSVTPVPAPADLVNTLGKTQKPVGRVLSTCYNLGFALVRLEHVVGVQEGRVRLVVHVPASETQPARAYAVQPCLPPWWPDENVTK